jgi:hypothetical protein
MLGTFWPAMTALPVPLASVPMLSALGSTGQPTTLQRVSWTVSSFAGSPPGYALSWMPPSSRPPAQSVASSRRNF